MLTESEPLKWWEQGGIRRSVVIAFGLCVLVAGLGFIPDVEQYRCPRGHHQRDRGSGDAPFQPDREYAPWAVTA
jgi:hypothetical protein